MVIARALASLCIFLDFSVVSPDNIPVI
eukprot:Gb_24998 [translate_table: standard]